MEVLALTLGHNSSAIRIKDGVVIAGYEEERLTGIKSDSSFPRRSIQQLQILSDLSKVDFVCVSHWDTFADIKNMSSKHWDAFFVRDTCPNATILSHSANFTHHDAHKEMARLYSGLPGYTIVADGFGNFNEVISVYYEDDLIHRVHGFDKSLGLLYQYATAFLGMKMNQDEYKLLGYEAHVGDIESEIYNILSNHISRMSKQYVLSSLSKAVKPAFDAVCTVDALPAVRESIHNHLNKVVNDLNAVRKLSDTEVKVCIAHLVQSIVEQSILGLVGKFNMKNVTLAGGLFYNVKLNNAVMKQVDKISVLPLAGDQGCGMGVYQHNFKDLVFPYDLCIGTRNLDSFQFHLEHSKCKFRHEDSSLREEIINDLKNNKVVNVVKGRMEFGPRALGNTTTLILPTLENVDYVNHLNGRSTIMPCAPIVTSMDYFEDSDKVVKSHEHMIITLDYKDDKWKQNIGAAHKYPLKDKYSGRPQMIYPDHWLHPVVDQFGLLVNTSYNKHGSPILFSIDQIIDTFLYQVERDHEDRVVTYIIQ